MMKFFDVLILPFILLLSSCGGLTGIYGIKKQKKLSPSEIIFHSKRYNVPISDSYYIDTTYLTYLKSIDTSKVRLNSHLQPLQALYYTQSKQLVSFHANCYAGGFPNLKWNRNSAFEVFPPKSIAPIDSLIPLFAFKEFIKMTNDEQNIVLSSNDYIIFVYWSSFMGRQTKRFISLIQKNLKLNKNNVKVFYINTDNLY